MLGLTVVLLSWSSTEQALRDRPPEHRSPPLWPGVIFLLKCVDGTEQHLAESKLRAWYLPRVLMQADVCDGCRVANLWWAGPVSRMGGCFLDEVMSYGQGDGPSLHDHMTVCDSCLAD